MLAIQSLKLFLGILEILSKIKYTRNRYLKKYYGNFIRKRMIKDNPSVSVVIPVYNHEKYIRESVESALNQDYDNFEVIVVDDGSTDNTSLILKEFDNRIVYIRQKNQGTAAALNKGIKNAKGKLIAWLSSDDLFLPEKIKYQVRKLHNEPSLALVYTDWIMIDSQGQELKVVNSRLPPSESFVREMLRVNFINGSSVLIRRSSFEKVGYFDETLPTDSDGDMWFRLLKNGYQFGHIPLPLIKYRWHSSNLSHKSRMHQACKDQVHVRALESFSAQELFGDLLKKKDIGIDSAYAELAWLFTRQFLFQSAKTVMKKFINDRFSFKRYLLWWTLLIVNTKPVFSILLVLLSLIHRLRHK